MSENYEKPKSLEEVSQRLLALEEKVANGIEFEDDDPLKNEGKISKAVLLKATEKAGKSARKVLGGVAVARLVLSMVVMVRLAIKSGWLTPDKQLGLMAVGAFILIGASFKIRKMDIPLKNYFSVAAIGIAMLYGTIYLGYWEYQYLTQNMVIVSGSITALLSIFLIYYNRHELYTHLAVAGTCLVPYAMHQFEYSLNYSGMYFAVVAILLSIMAVVIKDRNLHRLACYAGCGVFALLGSMSVEYTAAYKEQHTSIALFLALQFLFLAIGLVVHSLYHKALLSKKDALSYLPILLFFYGTFYAFMSFVAPFATPAIAVAIAALVLTLYFIAKRKLGELESGVMVFSFASVILFHAVYFELMPSKFAPWILIAVLFAVPFLLRKPEFDKHRKQFFVQVGFAILFALEYGRTIYMNFAESTSYWFIVSVAFSIALIAGRNIMTSVNKNPNLAPVYATISLAAIMYMSGVFSLYEDFGELHASLLGVGGLLILATSCVVLRYKATLQVFLVTTMLWLGKIIIIDVPAFGMKFVGGAVIAYAITGYIGYLLFRRSTNWRVKI